MNDLVTFYLNILICRVGQQLVFLAKLEDMSSPTRNMESKYQHNNSVKSSFPESRCSLMISLAVTFMQLVNMFAHKNFGGHLSSERLKRPWSVYIFSLAKMTAWKKIINVFGFSCSFLWELLFQELICSIHCQRHPKLQPLLQLLK